MTTSRPVTVQLRRRFGATAERVFDAWLDPDRVRQWMRICAERQPARGETVRIEIDARVGGTFTFVDRREGVEVAHTGQYLELDRPRRLVFTWSIPQLSPDADRVTVDVLADGEGCMLTLTAEMSPERAEYAARAAEGWGTMVDAVGVVVE